MDEGIGVATFFFWTLDTGHTLEMIQRNWSRFREWQRGLWGTSN